MSDHDLMQLIFLPGFTTAEQITNVSGRGVGMDVVKTNIEKIGGTVDMQSTPGQGTTLKIKIPLTLAIIPALIVTAGGDRFAIPQVSLLELVRLEGEQARRGIETIHGAPDLPAAGQPAPSGAPESAAQSLNLRFLSSGLARTSSREQTSISPPSARCISDGRHAWRDYSDGREEVAIEQVLSPDKCELGSWMNGHGDSPVRRTPRICPLGRCAQRDPHRSSEGRRVLPPLRPSQRGARSPGPSSIASRPRWSPRLPGSSNWSESASLVNIVVLQADGRRFGLVVDGINDTEEIVVKPLGKQLKGLSLFAGATIMGDGRVSLILDVAGMRAARGSRLGDDASGWRATRQPRRKRTNERAFGLSPAPARRRQPGGDPAVSGGPARGDSLLGDRTLGRPRGRPVPQPDHSPGAALPGIESRGYDQPEDQSTRCRWSSTRRTDRASAWSSTTSSTSSRTPSRCGRLVRAQGLIGSAVIQQRVTDVVDVPGLIRSCQPRAGVKSDGDGRLNDGEPPAVSARFPLQTFTLAIDVLEVQEVIRYQEMTRVPTARPSRARPDQPARPDRHGHRLAEPPRPASARRRPTAHERCDSYGRRRNQSAGRRDRRRPRAG